MNDNYLLKFDEINQFSAGFDGTLEDLLNYAYELLKNGYIDGWLYAQDSLKADEMAYDESVIEGLIFTDIDGKDAFDRLEEAFNEQDQGRINRILDTEFHRMYNEGEMGRARSVELPEEVAEVVGLAGAEALFTVKKVWTTVGDNKVRDTHAYLAGVAVPLTAEFITYDGDSAQAPGGFKSAENNCGCRCWLEFTST